MNDSLKFFLGEQGKEWRGCELQGDVGGRRKEREIAYVWRGLVPTIS